jgi:chemotaxis protein histidine kinase CheA
MTITSTTTTTLRILVAPFKNFSLAMPMDSVRKVARTKDLEIELDKNSDRVRIDDHDATVIRLYEWMYGEPCPEPETHVALIQMPYKNFALPMAALPTITLVAVSALRPISTEYRRLYNLDMASHIFSLAMVKSTETVFLIEPERLAELA